jgi:hypothetical protein
MWGGDLALHGLQGIQLSAVYAHSIGWSRLIVQSLDASQSLCSDDPPNLHAPSEMQRAEKQMYH